MNIFCGDKLLVKGAFGSEKNVRALAKIGETIMVCSESDYAMVDRENAEKGYEGIGVKQEDVLAINGIHHNG